MDGRSLVDIVLDGRLLEREAEGYRTIVLRTDLAIAVLARSPVSRRDVVRIPPTTPTVIERAAALWHVGATPLVLSPDWAWSDLHLPQCRTWQWGEAIAPSIDDRGGEQSDASEPAAVIHASSGSTGRPHFVRRTSASLAAEVERYSRRYQLRRGSYALLFAPICHSFGWGALLALLGAGCRTEVAAAFHPRRALQRLLDEPIDVTMMTPQMLRAIVSAAARVSSRRAHSASHGLQVIVGAGAVTPELDRACRDVLGVGVSRNYGSTETGATFGGPPRDDASLGPPFNGVDILEPAPLGRGELVLRLPERSDKPYRTGDIVVRQANDVVEVVGRVDEMAKINGYNVDTEALAAAARRLPGVADAVAVVVPRPESSEIVDLYLLLAGSAVDADAARHALLNDRPLLRASLRITNCRELPRDAVGKISKADVMNLIDRTTKWHGPS